MFSSGMRSNDAKNGGTFCFASIRRAVKSLSTDSSTKHRRQTKYKHYIHR